MPTPFRFARETIHDVPLIRLSGDLTYDQNVNSLHQAAAELRAAGHTRIALELADVATVDSTGIGALVDIRQMFGATGGVVLVRASARLRASLAIIHVTDLFELVQHEDELPRVITRNEDETP